MGGVGGGDGDLEHSPLGYYSTNLPKHHIKHTHNFLNKVWKAQKSTKKQQPKNICNYIQLLPLIMYVLLIV